MNKVREALPEKNTENTKNAAALIRYDISRNESVAIDVTLAR